MGEGVGLSLPTWAHEEETYVAGDEREGQDDPRRHGLLPLEVVLIVGQHVLPSSSLWPTIDYFLLLLFLLIQRSRKEEGEREHY